MNTTTPAIDTELTKRTGLQSPATMILKIAASAARSAVQIHRITLAYQGLLQAGSGGGLDPFGSGAGGGIDPFGSGVGAGLGQGYLDPGGAGYNPFGDGGGGGGE